MPYKVHDVYCPACGQESISYDEMNTHRLSCDNIFCPRHMAVQEILGDSEIEHIVTLGDGSFSMKHPLRERLDNQLLSCTLGEHIAECGQEYVQGGVFFDDPIPLNTPHRVYCLGEGEDVYTEWEPLDG